jgi:hypothetical protein
VLPSSSFGAACFPEAWRGAKDTKKASKKGFCPFFIVEPTALIPATALLRLVAEVFAGTTPGRFVALRVNKFVLKA